MADATQTTEGVSAPTAPASTPAPAAEIASAQPADAKPAQSTEPAKPSAGSLTDSEDFRKFQSEADRRYNALQRQWQETRDQLRAQAAEAERLRLANASDDERANYYAQQVQAIRAQQEQNERAQAEYNYFNGLAYTMLQEAGMKGDDPRLSPYLSGGATPQGIAQLATGIAKIAAAEAREAKEEAAKAAKRGAIEALNEAGVTATSNGTGAGAAASAQSSARKAYEERLAKLRDRAQKGGSAATAAEWADLQKLKRAAEAS